MRFAKHLLQQDVIDAKDQQLLGLADNMTLNLTFWFSYEALLHDNRTPQVTIHQGVLQLLTMVAPYLGERRTQLLPRLRNHLRQYAGRHRLRQSLQQNDVGTDDLKARVMLPRPPAPGIHTEETNMSGIILIVPTGKCRWVTHQLRHDAEPTPAAAAVAHKRSSSRPGRCRCSTTSVAHTKS